MPATDNDVRVEFRDVPNHLRQLAEAGMDDRGPTSSLDQALWSICRLEKRITTDDSAWDLVNEVLTLREDLADAEAAR